MKALSTTLHWSRVLLLATFALLLWPLKELARRRALAGRGWVELSLAGEVLEIRKEDPVQEQLLRKALRKPDPRRVVLERLRMLVDELIEDDLAKGVLIRLGMLEGGWAGAESIRAELARLRAAGKHVIVHVERMVGNKELMVASAASRVLMPPTGMFLAAGVAAPGLFLEGVLSRFGIKFEVASAGRFKSAPDQFTRRDRSASDLEQTKALVDALDGALLASLKSGRGLEEEESKKLLGEAPMIGRRAAELGLIDAVAVDERLVEEVRAADGLDRSLSPLGAGRYLQVRRPPKPWERIERHVGVVRVVGNIVDDAPAGGFGPAPSVAAERPVVADLRAALRDPKVASVVLYVDSRGGSVTASDAIWAAVKRLDAEKPVIACFGDVSASGGYYVGCGARSIVCSPLTVTGSIGVFSVLPTWPELAKRFDVGHDVIKNLDNADVYNPWAGFDDARRAHAQKEVELMYEIFLERVSAARAMSRDAAHEVAQGRVWMGKDAHAVGLIDGLGGFSEALERARMAAKGKVAERPQLVKAKRPQSRPNPHRQDGAVSPADALRRLVASPGQGDLFRAVLGHGPEARLAAELATLWATRPAGGAGTFAWAPVALD